MPVEDDLGPPLVGADVGLRHDLRRPEVVLDGPGGRGAGQRGEQLLVPSVSEVCRRALNVSEAEEESTRIRILLFYLCSGDIIYTLSK